MFKCTNGQYQFPVSVSQPTLAMPVLVLTIGNCPLARLHICTFEDSEAGVESMHWSLDVTFGEDYCRARREHAAENRAAARRIAFNLLRRYGIKHKCGTKMGMMFANQRKGALDEMLSV